MGLRVALVECEVLGSSSGYTPTLRCYRQTIKCTIYKIQCCHTTITTTLFQNVTNTPKEAPKPLVVRLHFPKTHWSLAAMLTVPREWPVLDIS
jgi:hypothetical protein